MEKEICDKSFAELAPNVRWIQSTWAGVEVLFEFFQERKENPAQLPPITRFAGEMSDYGPQMSEWFFSKVISFERKFHVAVMNQTKRIWQPYIRFESLVDKQLLIVGFGAIGQHVARVAIQGFQMRVAAIKHSLRDEEKKSFLNDACLSKVELFKPDQLKHVLNKGVDYIFCLCKERGWGG